MDDLDEPKYPSPPRFKSFKALPKVKKETAKTTRSASRDQDQEQHSSTKRRHRSRQRDSGEHQSRRRRSRSRHEAVYKAREPEHAEKISTGRKSSAALEKTDLKVTDGQHLFIRDTKGDQDNLRYGVSSRYSGPRYRESGSRRVLGLSRKYRTKPSEEHGLRLVTTDQPDNDRHDQKRLSDMRAGEVPEVVLTMGRSEADIEADTHLSFLPLRSHAKKRRKLESRASARPHSSTREPQDASVGARGELQDQLEHNGDEEESSESDASSQPDVPQDHTRSVREENARLSRLVQSSPFDLDAWFALIEHQEALLAIDGRAKRELTKAETRGLADIRISLYEKALSKVTDDSRQSLLVQGMMKEGAKIWDTKKLSWAWNDALEAHPGNADLWMEFLIFQQTKNLGFSYKETWKQFEKFFTTFKGGPTAAIASVRTEEIKVYLFLRLTTFMRDSGFPEQALGLWQAMIEFNFFRPSDVLLSAGLDQFQAFWDSEVARFGDQGARGWNESTPDSLPVTSGFSSAEAPSGEPFASWADAEQSRTASSALPAYTSDDAEPIDDFTFALFSDLCPFLFHVIDDKARLSLIGNFLAFHGLPSTLRGLSSGSSLSGDPFIGNPLSRAGQNSLQPWIKESTSTSLFGFPINAFVLDTSSLFARDGKWFCPWKDVASLFSSQSHSDWIRRALCQLTTTINSDDLAEYVVALEAQFDPKGARKLAKSLLKKRNSVRLYNAVALIEANHGTFSNAEQVWLSIIGMKASFSAPDQSEMSLIWLSFLWALLNKGDFKQALTLCLYIPTGEYLTAKLDSRNVDIQSESGHLSVQRSIEFLFALLEKDLNHNQPYASLYTLDLLVLTTYLTSRPHRHLPTALAHYTTFSTHPTLTETPLTLTLMHQSRARLIHFHTSTSPSGFRVREATAPLVSSLALFPSNTIFLNLYQHLTRHALLTDRIRDVLPTLSAPQSAPSAEAAPTATKVLYPPSQIPALFNLWREFHRPSFAGYTSAAIRGAFEACAAVVGGAAGHSPYLWMLWILWEEHVAGRASAAAAAKDSKASKASSGKGKDKAARRAQGGQTSIAADERVVETIHRALRACPWSKAVSLCGIKVLEGIIGRVEREGGGEEAGQRYREQVQGVYGLLVDRGIRILTGGYWEPQEEKERVEI